MSLSLCSMILAAWVSVHAQTPLPKTCDSEIYCYGDLLDVVQTAQIFPDSKTFVDMKLKRSVNETLDRFRAFLDRTNQNPTKEEIKGFVDRNFEDGGELEDWTPPDFRESPSFLDKIRNEDVRKFAANLVGLWPILGRKVRPEVARNPEYYSLIPVPNGLIIPGGRFREFYYWDSYWIVKGLLISEMYATARGMIENLISMVKTYGFVPNGGRVYYTERSQPPLLTPMAYEYVERSKDLKWLKQNIQHLDRELKFWLNKRTVSIEKNMAKYTLALYRAESSGPRPESYIEDIRTAEFYSDEAERQEVYFDLKSGAESGWDFTTRWIFDYNGGTNANLSYIHTRRVIPVDLNAFLFRAFKNLAQLYAQLNKPTETLFWFRKAADWRTAIDKILWNENDGVWYDLDLKSSKQRTFFAVSNLAPLWAGAFDAISRNVIGKKAVKYLRKHKIDEFFGGTSTTLERSGQQWDAPNAWPPLQAILVQGLENTKNSEARCLAEELAKRWIRANMIGFENTGMMFEKYDAEHPGQYGGGGEYEVQSGFGWTNGVILEFIDKYE